MRLSMGMEATSRATEVATEVAPEVARAAGGVEATATGGPEDLGEAPSRPDPATGRYLGCDE